MLGWPPLSYILNKAEVSEPKKVEVDVYSFDIFLSATGSPVDATVAW